MDNFRTALRALSSNKLRSGLTMLGGVLGVAAGWAIAQTVTTVQVTQAVVTPTSVGLAFVVTLAVGVMSGLYPAFRASRLRPIEALRYE